MAAPKSPSTYPPPQQPQAWAPSQPAWSPPSAVAPAVQKPAGPVQGAY